MTTIDTARIAWQALLRSKMRSFLTMLGIVIGVFAVIATVAAGEGAKVVVEDAFASMGSNMLMVLSGSNMRGGAFGGLGSSPTLTWDDLDAIREEVPEVRYAAAQLRTNVQVQSEDRNWSTSVIGTSPDFFSIRDWAFEYGASFIQSDVDGGAKVVVLGQTVIEKLYGRNANPVGETMRVKGVPFQIVGVLERKGHAARGEDTDDTAIVPQSSFQSKIQGGLQQYIRGSIMLSAASKDASPRVRKRITELLRDRHRIQPGADDDFSVNDLSEITGAVTSGLSAISALLAAIAAISLLVGGIGIMNIMLVSVTERTREIGLRMAVGAKPINILTQFLAESVALSLVGGMIGTTLGISTAQVVAARWGWTIPIRPEIVALAVGFSALVGIGFGVYPARKAARLDPIDALRYE